MSTAIYIAYTVIAVAFVAFFIIAHIAYDQFRLKAWQPLLMCVTVLLLLLMIMKSATNIANREHQQRGAVGESAAP